MKIDDFQQNESRNPASAYKIPRAEFESRKKVATVTHLKRESWLGFMKFQWFYRAHESVQILFSGRSGLTLLSFSFHYLTARDVRFLVLVKIWEHTDATGGSGRLPRIAARIHGPLFFLKPTSKVENKCRQLHTLTTSMSKTQWKSMLFSPKGAKNSQNIWTNRYFHRTEGQNPASAYKFPEA